LTGEHGDGRLRAPLLGKMWGGPDSTAMHLFSAVKAAFDPDGVLNPGVKLPVADEQSIDVIKYDPALPPLPPAARHALDRVADKREYAVSRLELLGLDAGR
jgi:FAD linked oxidases, C-terminal domain